ncbi:MAG: glycosyl hydrolase [Bacteroidota bacterium]
MRKYAKTCWIVLFLCSLQVSGQRSHSNRDLQWPTQQKEHLPGTYWWWLGSAVDRENLTYNLESLREAGIGNVHIIPIYGAKGYEENYINFLSPGWMEMLSHTLNEATRLDMNVDMSTTTGWPFGGSHVTPYDAAKKIEYKRYTLSGGETFREKIDTTDLQCVMAYSGKGEIIDITGNISENRSAGWTLPQGEWRIYALWKKGTGQKVKRAAPGNEGLVLDPFSVTSLNRYLERYDRAFGQTKGTRLRAQYHDSYEYYHASYTWELFSEFQSRRGYDLKHHLPALTGDGTIEEISRIKADYRTTMAELHLEYIDAWTSWAHNHGWITRNEGHGAPANLLDLYAASDIPETEIFGATKFDIPGLSRKRENISTGEPPDPLILQFASSAAHLSGKKLVASETCTWLRDHFKASLAQAKPEIDQLFLAGINHIFYHGNAYSPKEAAWPGWMFYASTHFEQKNAFWRDLPALNRYVGRCQSILQSGQPANEILLYWPVADIWHQYSNEIIKTLNVHSIDWMTNSSFGRVADWLKEKGYAFDYLSDQQLQQIEFNSGKLETGGASYQTIVIPATEHMPLKTWERLETLARAGATIIIDGSLPKDVPGWFELEKRRNRLHTSLAALKFESVEDKMLKSAIGGGEILTGSDREQMLASAGVDPEPMVRHGIKYIRRTHAEGYHYFIANQSDQTVDGWVPMATPIQSAVILDPRVSDKSGLAAVRQYEEQSEIYLQLEPGESFIIRTFTDRETTGEPWVYLQKEEEPLEIQGEWKVKFIDGGPLLPSPFKTDQLDSWTNLGDQEAKRFAGTALYTVSFNLPDTMSADHWQLDLGEVRESARIRINGQKLGTLWSIPFSVEFDKYLKREENSLEVEVTNLSANRLRDLDQQGVEWEKYFFIGVSYRDFNASTWPLMESGLMGPVRLTPLKVVNPLNDQ